ncbi:MAG TPA: phosphoribosylformylglycinamidine synthase subunit PurL [Solirubrobacteraceae bacterium]|nr:phosphoribosylformylglycinamidine synthase subunit PurL [Solirubrobacteraceae bacterium]
MPDTAATANAPTVEDALALGLTREEYDLACRFQGGPPNQVELAMYSLLWSEHCAYKHSKKLLKTLPTEGPHVVMGPGENAGAVDVGGGLVCAFKVESHNHPSAVEPFQGAATGVGGILRDIFAIGARPIAVLDSLRFGEPAQGDDRGERFRGRVGQTKESGPGLGGGVEAGEEDPKRGDAARAYARARYLLDGAVRGIAHYGNSIGVPTVGGEVYFEEPYTHNCLVNAMALGLAPRERLIRSAAAGPGNVVVLFGASTGRDGIGGASVLASAELDAGGDDAKRPTVQVGDPFEESKLLECSLELLDRGLIVSLQDLGAAGLTSSAAEMASGGGVGIDLDVALVPLREPNMAPFEIMVSESQERMLCVVEPGRLDAVLALCAKWEIGGSAIGTVTDSGRIRVFDGSELVGDMPVAALVDECPLYDLSPARPSEPIYPAPVATLARDAPARETLLALLSSPNIASRRPLFEHYDAIVQSRTVRRPEETDAAVLAIGRGSDASPAGEEEAGPAGGVRARANADAADRDVVGGPVPALAVSIDCNGRRVAADPYNGTVEAVLECAANLACVGAEPLGTTNNLNFGNPEKPHIAWQLTESVRGLGDACRALGAPIVGGNVSLYNETPSGPIYPTPVIGMVGSLPDARHAGRLGFARPGDTIALVGPFAPSLDASELSKLWGCALPEGLPAIDVAAVRSAQFAVRGAVRVGGLSSAHDIAEGGLAIALTECCLASGLGADVRLDALAGAGGDGDGDLFRVLFGEGPGGFLVSGIATGVRALGRRTQVRVIGTVGGEGLRIAAGGVNLSATLSELADAHTSLRELFP